MLTQSNRKYSNTYEEGYMIIAYYKNINIAQRVFTKLMYTIFIQTVELYLPYGVML